jgi:hypothetical protein
MIGNHNGELICSSGDRCYVHLKDHPTTQVKIRRVVNTRGRWNAEGSGVCSVPGCKTLCMYIEEHLPVEFEELPCASCTKKVKYIYAIEYVEIGDDGADDTVFEFSATVTCPRCTRKSMPRRVAASLRRIKRVKIWPDLFRIRVLRISRDELGSCAISST